MLIFTLEVIFLAFEVAMVVSCFVISKGTYKNASIEITFMKKTSSL